ncbi:hypothetical protein AURDEDRAFT_174859 [Auricularia subglabra TFB-10046 SS5]|nr:hypothetical protein AURDEDRAFT_174859 [Auricularia subglabra TFB-10046 SS5]
MAPTSSTAATSGSPPKHARRRRHSKIYREMTTKVVALGVDSPRRRSLGLSHVDITWTIRRGDRVRPSKDEQDALYRLQVDPNLLGPLPSFRRSSKVPAAILPLREWNSTLFEELMANRPRFNDPTIQRFWGHLEATWEDAILGYRWRWPDKSPPYRVAITEDEIRRIVEDCKWIRSLVL